MSLDLKKIFDYSPLTLSSNEREQILGLCEEITIFLQSGSPVAVMRLDANIAAALQMTLYIGVKGIDSGSASLVDPEEDEG